MFGKCKVENICYYISDVDKTESFYRDVLGVEILRMEGEDAGDDWLMATMANNVNLLFFKQESRAGDSPMIVFSMDEGGIDDVVAGLAAQGVTIVTPVSHAPDGWSAEIQDPDGHVLSMYQPENMPRTHKS